ncbi:MAG: Na+/H+ antiporter NhaA [Bacteroidales bacterium]|nr:Na+/H+ antiporter NhaA [Bacteroidales bacterium]MBN2819272.1 Na+/H+ antiporter NhaA [Bacteroidales bacterium]
MTILFCSTPSEKDRIILSNKQLAALDNLEERIFHVQSPVKRLEHILHKFVTCFVMPVFALANAGVLLTGIGLSNIFGGLSSSISFSLLAL